MLGKFVEGDPQGDGDQVRNMWVHRCPFFVSSEENGAASGSLWRWMFGRGLWKIYVVLKVGVRMTEHLM